MSLPLLLAVCLELVFSGIKEDWAGGGQHRPFLRTPLTTWACAYFREWKGLDDRDLDALRGTLRCGGVACESGGRSLGKEKRKKLAKWTAGPGMWVDIREVKG